VPRPVLNPSSRRRVQGRPRRQIRRKDMARRRHPRPPGHTPPPPVMARWRLRRPMAARASCWAGAGPVSPQPVKSPGTCGHRLRPDAVSPRVHHRETIGTLCLSLLAGNRLHCHPSAASRRRPVSTTKPAAGPDRIPRHHHRHPPHLRRRLPAGSARSTFRDRLCGMCWRPMRLRRHRRHGAKPPAVSSAYIEHRARGPSVDSRRVRRCQDGPPPSRSDRSR
jgi:hypothetical protein